MNHRFTIKELNAMSDNEILRILVEDRKSNLNLNAPLYLRLQKIHNNLSEKIFEQGGDPHL